MADSRSKSVVEIAIDDSTAKQRIDDLIRRLESAQKAATGVFGAGGGPSTSAPSATSTAPAGSGGTAPAAGAAAGQRAAAPSTTTSTTTSTAPSGSGGRPPAQGKPSGEWPGLGGASSTGPEGSGGRRPASTTARAQGSGATGLRNQRQRQQQEMQRRSVFFRETVGMITHGAGGMASGSPTFGADMATHAMSRGGEFFQRRMIMRQMGMSRGVGALASEGGAVAAEGAAASEVAGAGGMAGRLGAGGMAGLGLAAVGVGVAVGAGKIASAGYNQRYSMAQQGAALERQQELASRTGGASIGPSSAAMRSAAAQGFAPGEAAGTLSSYYQQIGVQGSAGSAQSPFSAMLEGVSSGSLARYQRAPTLSQMQSNAASLPSAMGLAQGLGISGGQTDELLSRIAAASDRMVEKGLQLNREGTLELAASLGAARPEIFGGTVGVGASTRLSQMGQGAAQGFSGMFGGLATSAIQAEAFSSSSSPMAALRRMEKMSADPRLARKAVISQLGPEVASLAFAGQGFGADQAEALAGKLPPGAITPSLGGGRAGPLSRAMAQGQQRNLAAGLQNPEMTRQMIATAAALKAFTIDFSAKFDAFAGPALRLLEGFNR